MSFTSPLHWYWVIAPLVVGVLAIVLFVHALFHIARGHLAHATLHAGSGVILALAALGVGLLVLNTQGYARLTSERPVAEVTVAALHPALQTWRVNVHRLDSAGLTASCGIQGDEWEMSAVVQKWQPWVNILGLDSTYALDEINNKYFSAARGNGRTITACSLAAEQIAWMPHGLVAWLMDQVRVQQRNFGSAVYMPLADGAIYRVIMTQGGLNAEAVNPVAQAAVARRL